VKFKLHAPFKPTGDQPEAIKKLVSGLDKGYQHQVLLGATGTGKTFTIASVIEKTQKATLVLAHNKTLVAQLYAEFKEFFPDNAVEYFTSYYDYYQPEAYIPRHDLFIEKETAINDEIERLRLGATTSLLSRKDVIIVASVSCIYGLGNPEAYGKVVIDLKKGEMIRRNTLLRRLVECHYTRNDVDISSGSFRVRGDSLDVVPAYQDKTGYRIALFGDEIERITHINMLTGEIIEELEEVSIYPAKHFITEEEKLQQAIITIKEEMEVKLADFKEMLKEVGYCSGIENYSRHLDQRAPGTPPWTLIDYLPPDYMLVVDESHMTIPQVRGMYNGDRSRKQVLVDYGFRLPSAMDNRPLNFDEFEQRMGQTIYTSATPSQYEFDHAQQVVDQIIRPTGLVDPEIDVRPVDGQVDDLIGEIREKVAKGERVLVTTLTKRMAEDLSDYLQEMEFKVHYLHSEIDTLERVGILRDLRMGVFDVVVGINLLREGLDLPEVSLVAILDADKQGFLRSKTSLIQTVGRAARHINGQVIMYGARITDAMRAAIDETDRRRKIQVTHNKKHGIEPMSIVKAVRDITDQLRPSSYAVAEEKGSYTVGRMDKMQKTDLENMISQLEKEMKAAAQELQFEQAALLRDRIFELRSILAEDPDLKPWEKINILAGSDD